MTLETERAHVLRLFRDGQYQIERATEAANLTSAITLDEYAALKKVRAAARHAGRLLGPSDEGGSS